MIELNPMRPDGSAAAGHSLLEVRELSVVYPNAAQAIADVTFQLHDGEALAIMGQSAAGKSTIALAIAGLLPASASISGEVEFRGRSLVGLSGSEWRRLRGCDISVVWQEPATALNPLLRVGPQVEEAIRAHRDWPRARREAETRAMLRLVALLDPDVYDAYPHQLSGGQLQRVVLAQALVCRPSLLLADEPAASLDGVTQIAIIRLLESLRHGMGLGIVFITHNPALIPGFAERVLVLHNGRIVEHGATPDVFAHPSHPHTREILDTWRSPRFIR